VVVGVGLIVAAGAVLFYDVFDIAAVVLQALAYLTPTFYPIAIVPDHLRPIMNLNVFHAHLLVFRGFAYEGQLAPAWAFAVMGLSAVASLALGIRVFARSWKNLVVLL
jgi:ABC-type polysaccharide/polyol phosphate export permease